MKLPPTLRVFSLLLLVVLQGCGSSPSAGPETPAPSTAPSDTAPTMTGHDPAAGDPPAGATPQTTHDAAHLRSIWTQFVEDWNSGDRSRLDAWSAPSGVFLLDNPGAFVRVRHLPNLEAVFALEGNYDGARVKTVTLTAETRDGSIPQPNCETEPALPSGVFVGPGDGKPVAERVENLAEYDLASDAEVESMRGPAKQVAQETQFIVYDATQAIKFYFGGAQGRHLLAVDAVIPCSA